MRNARQRIDRLAARLGKDEMLNCSVWLRSDWLEHKVPISEGIEMLLDGEAYSIEMPLNYTERKLRDQALHDEAHAEIDRVFDQMRNTYKDQPLEYKQALIKCTMPHDIDVMIVHQQRPPRHKYWNGMPVLGWYDTEDGREFWEPDAQKFCEENGIAFLLCPDWEDEVYKYRVNQGTD